MPQPTLRARQPTRVPHATARASAAGLLYPSHGRASLVPNPSARLTSQHSPTLAYTRLHSPAIARASLATRACLPAMAIHPMNPMHPHASSCIACIRMPLHVSTCPTRVPSVRPPSRHKAPGVQHPSGPHAIRSSELDCCQSYSTPPSKQVRASRRTAFEFLHHPFVPPGIVLAQWHELLATSVP